MCDGFMFQVESENAMKEQSELEKKLEDIEAEALRVIFLFECSLQKDLDRTKSSNSDG